MKPMNPPTKPKPKVEFVLQWILLTGEVITDATRYPSREAAEADAALAKRNRWHWSDSYRIVEKSPL